MKKKFLTLTAFLCAVTMLLSFMAVFNYAFAEEVETPVLVTAVSEEDSTDDVNDLVETVTSDVEEELELESVTDEELLEAEPSELPIVDEDPVLTKRLWGRMLLDVEGNGEVYYIDPITGGKEYLADGESAQLLLKRRALGINEANFAKLIIGKEKEETSVCEESDLGSKLKGRIVLRVEEKGEAYWIYPVNCRAYYAGTFAASYELMKKFSLGIQKKELAKIRNNARQRMKNALRLSVYAHAEDNDMNLKEAREDLKDEVNAIKTCMENSRDANEGKPTSEQNKERVRACVQESNLPKISQERRNEIKETINETRQERIESENSGVKKGLSGIDLKKALERVKNMIKNRKNNNL